MLCLWQRLYRLPWQYNTTVAAVCMLNFILQKVITIWCSCRSLFSGVGALLSLPSHLSVIIDAAGSRWVNNRPERYGKFISQYISSLMATDDNL